MTTLAENLQAIIDKAPGLRKAGVTSVGGEVPFTLAPLPPPEGKAPAREIQIGEVDDFLDERDRRDRRGDRE